MRATPILAATILLGACSQADGSVASNAMGTRSFALSGFDRVTLKGSDDVRVISGPSFAITATGPEATLDDLELIVDGQTLKVGRKKHSGWNIGWSKSGHKGALVTVTMPAIVGASVAGSGNMAVDRASGAAFEASVAGSGNLNVASAKVGKLDVDLAGSGDVNLAGTASAASISLAGSGDVAAKAMIAKTADISVAGSGNVDLRATGATSVSLIGSGDVTIAGTSDCKVSKVGSGEVRCTP